MFVFGAKVNPGILGVNPTIDPASTANSNLPMQYDFRSVYGSILQDWFCVPDTDIDSVMLKNFQKLKIMQDGNCIPTSVHDHNAAAGENLVYAYPNPYLEMVPTGIYYVRLQNEQIQQVKSMLKVRG